MSQGIPIRLPDVRTGRTVAAEVNKTEQKYRSIFASLMFQYVIQGSIEDMASCRACDAKALTSMCADRTSVIAAGRS